MRHFVGTSYRIRKQGRELIAAYRTQEAAGKGLPNGTIFDHFASEEGGKLVMNESQREAEGRSLLIAGEYEALGGKFCFTTLRLGQAPTQPRSRSLISSGPCSRTIVFARTSSKSSESVV